MVASSACDPTDGEALGHGSPNPPTLQRDLALGRFMDAWSQLESMLRELLHVLSHAPREAAWSIAAAIPDLGRMRELLEALGRLYLSEDDQKELADILQYLRVSNGYRNAIVHGQWGLTNNRSRAAIDGVIHDFMWIRIYVVIDKRREFGAALGLDTKTEKQYVFTVKKLEERVEKLRAFAHRVGAFGDAISKRLRPITYED